MDDGRLPGDGRRWMTYEEAVERHPGCRVDLAYRPIDATFSDVERVPVDKAPAIFVWPDRATAAAGDASRLIAVYWLRDVD